MMTSAGFSRQGQETGRAVLQELRTLVAPEALLAWHCKLIAKKYGGSKRRGPGRPRTQDDIQQLVVRMATENRGWGVWARAAFCAGFPSIHKQAPGLETSSHPAFL
jgi:hypothetical protein